MGENLLPETVSSIMRQLKDLMQSPAEGIRVRVNEENVTDILAELDGPTDTPFEGGTFKMKLTLPADYPNNPPRGFFTTKIFHPNIRQPSGEICVNTLKRDWQPTHGLRHILMVIRCLLIEPFPESALNEEAGKLLLEDYDEYFRRAKMYTSIHAKPETSKADAGAASTGAAAKKAEKKKLDKKKSLRRL